MPDKSIVLFDWEILALQDGRMSMKRVPVKPQPRAPTDFRYEGDTPQVYMAGGVWKSIECPYVAGEKLWVKEAWATDEHTVYRATNPEWDDGVMTEAWRWWPPYAMPRQASRYTIVVTDVMPPERVWDISTFDCIMEGGNILTHEGCISYDGLYDWYKSHWTEDYARRRGLGWDDNPWCWPFKFELAKESK